jgi:hypothetical protein
VSPVLNAGQAVTGGTVFGWPSRRPARFWSSTPAATMYRQSNPRVSVGLRIRRPLSGYVVKSIADE